MDIRGGIRADGGATSEIVPTGMNRLIGLDTVQHIQLSLSGAEAFISPTLSSQSIEFRGCR